MSSKKEISAMKEDGTPAFLPKRRFPEFRDSKGWEKQLLASFLEDCSGRVPPDTELPIYSSTREGLRRQDSYFDGRVLQNNNEYGVVPPGCFVYRHMSDDGLFKFNINDTGGDIAVSKEYPVFRSKGLNSNFLLTKLNEDPEFKQFALSQKAGGTRTRLYFSRLCEWRTPLPCSAEQERIADCLTSLDAIIAAQARKVDTLKTHKTGLMQRLFPREGEAVPRLRFPEFRKAGEWKEATLGQLAKLVRGPFGGSLKKEIFVTSGYAVYEQQHAIYSNFSAFRYHITEEKFRELRRFAVAANDIIMSCSGTMGKFAIIPEGAPAGVINQALLKLTPNRSCNAGFLKEFLELPSVQQKLLSQSAGGAIQNVVSVDQIKALPLRLPSAGEQETVMGCLSSFDDLIAGQSAKLEALKTLKRGLMQQLFPSLDETRA